MKSQSRKLILIVLLLVPAFMTQAANYTWDVTTGDSAISDGSGAWQVGVGNWYDSSSYDQVWTNGNKAIIGSGTLGGAGTVTLGGNVSGSLNLLAAADSGNYTLDLNGYTNSLSDFDANIGAATYIITNGVIALTSSAGTRSITTTTGSLNIYSKITGAYNLVKFGSGNLKLLNDASDFTGSLNINNGKNVTVTSIGSSGVASAAGAGNSVIIANNAGLIYIGVGDNTDRQLRIGTRNSTIFQNGSGPLILAGAFANTHSSSEFPNQFVLRGSNTNDNEILGNIIDSTSDADGDPLKLTKTDAGRWILSGTNTYTGNTAINSGTLVLAEGGETRFVIGGAGTNNMLTGSATVMLDGAFRFDLSGASTTVGDAWQIVGTSLNETFGETFSVLSAARPFSQVADIWVAVENGVAYGFSPANGTLTVIPGLGMVTVIH